jgi:hypothetical protein
LDAAPRSRRVFELQTVPASRTQSDAHRLFGQRHLSIRNVRAGNAHACLLLPLDFARIGLKFDRLVALQELALEIRRQLH